MKKIFSIFWLLPLSLVSLITMGSCGHYNTNPDNGNNGSENNNTGGDNESSNALHEWENNWQYGPKYNKKTESESKNKYLDYFFGDPQFNYATYTVEGNKIEDTLINEKVTFNGDLENVKKTPTNNIPTKLWRNDTKSIQLVFFKENSNDKITDLKVSINNDSGIESTAKFIRPIKSNNHISNSNSEPVGVQGIFYNYDEIASNTLNEIKFDFQPILITTKTFDDTLPGEYTLNINLEFQVNDGIYQQIIIKHQIDVSNHLIDRSIKEIDDIGTDSMSFPTSS